MAKEGAWGTLGGSELLQGESKRVPLCNAPALLAEATARPAQQLSGFPLPQSVSSKRVSSAAR